MTDAEICDSLLPGLPPPPTGPVVFRQSSVVPVTAASGLSASAQLNTLSAAPTVPTVTSSVSGQPATTAVISNTDPASSGSTSTVAGKPLVFTDEPVAVPVAPVTSSTSSTTSTTSTTGSSTTTTISPSQSSSVIVAGATTVMPATTTSGTTTPSSTTTTTLTTASTSPAVTVSTTSATAPVVVVRQLQTVHPYNGTTSWKLFRDHFNRVAKVNGWTSNDDLIQHLTLLLEGAAAEVLRDFDDTASTALTDLWAKLEHGFGEVDSCREAMRKFEIRRQSDSESLVEFEQALRILHKEAWPSATASERDAPLKRRFEDGVASTELLQYLCLHHRDLNFAQTVEKARIFHATTDTSKSKSKAVRFLNDTECVEVLASEKDLLPVMNHLKSIEGRLDKMVAKPGKNQTKSPSSSVASTPPATPPPTPPSQQQSWRPRNPQSNQRFSGQGQQQRPPFQPRTFQPQTGRFPAPRFQNAPWSPRPWRPPGSPRVFVPSNSSRSARADGHGACYVCGTPGCHSRFHGFGRSASRPTSPHPTTESDNRPYGCYVCRQPGCHSDFHRSGGRASRPALPRPQSGSDNRSRLSRLLCLWEVWLS